MHPVVIKEAGFLMVVSLNLRVGLIQLLGRIET